MKRIRSDETRPVEQAAWNAAAKNWTTVTRGASLALNLVRKAPAGVVLPPNKLARAVLGTDRIPLYSVELPGGGAARKRRAGSTERPPGQDTTEPNRGDHA